jgi:hypothetical protein
VLGYFGPEGTFTHQALLSLKLDEEATPFPSVAATLDAVREGSVRAGLVPIENSVEGGVSATLDNLASTMAEFDLSHVDLLMVDIQGFEEVLLPRALEQFAAAKVRFLIVSTHHHLISGNPTTHQDVLALLVAAGAHIIVEHNVSESYSGDGLIAASFDPRDDDFTLEVSYNRASASLFGGLETELGDTQRQLAAARAELEASEAARRRVSRDLADLRSTRVLRYSARARSAYAAIRSRLPRR